MSDQDKDLEQEIIEKEQTDDAPDTNKDEKDGYKHGIWEYAKYQHDQSF